MAFFIPKTSERVTIVGKTGSGKTQGGAFILSQSPFDQIPYVILDFKREALFNEIEEIRFLPLEPKAWKAIEQPGLFIVQPMPADEDIIEELLWYIWDHEFCGLFIDEGYMIGKSRAFIACLTQGRSKNIPIITLSQRPAWITKFAFSEADYMMIFRLLTRTDKKTVEEFVGDYDINQVLPPHWSWWYDVNRDTLARLRPVPDRDWIKRAISIKLQNLAKRQVTKQFV